MSLHPAGCSSLDKLPDLFVDVDRIRLPNCTYQIAINVAVGYDPVILEQIEKIQIITTTNDDVFFNGRRDFLMPYNTVRYVHFLALSANTQQS